jgi:phosphatidate cytidylyltransferase
MVDKTSLAKRIWSSFLILSLAGLVIFIFPNWVFSLLAAALVGIGLAEFFGIAEKRGILVYKYFGIIIGTLVPVITYFQLGMEGYFTVEPIMIMIACLFLFVLQFTRRDTSQAITSISVTMFGLLYIAWLFSFFIKLKFLPQGALLVAFIILVTKIGDVGAYFVGSFIGKRALIPRISPKKTVEGTIGGLVFSLLAALASKLYLPSFSFAHLFTLGILLGILGQVGDLAESVLKRDSGVKDSGANMPGFGGVLDMIDSLLFTVPIFYFYVVVLMK